MSKGEILEKKINVVGENNTPVNIVRLISDEGGQGEVYQVTYRGRDYAMKWYCKHPSDVIGGSQYDTIKEIHGERNKPSNRFIWPLVMVTEEYPKPGKRFGYLMDLLPDGYKEMNDFLRKDGDIKAARFKSYNSMLCAGMGIAKAMQDLHTRGWSYKDLNPKNFAINPDNGDVLVVDNDNVSVDKYRNKKEDWCSVKGMRGYMAPEIPRSHYEKNPSMETDRYSLAIVLYRLFFIDHPMEGKIWEKYPLCTDKVEDKLYAINPVFHFDPKDRSNRPTNVYAPNAKVRWPIESLFSKELRDTFIVAFTDGIDNPGSRPTELQWITVMAKTRDRLIQIRKGQEQFVNFEKSETMPRRCLVLSIIRRNRFIAVWPRKAIYNISLTGETRQFSKIDGGIVYDKDIDKLLIRNLSDQVWHCTSPNTNIAVDLGKGQEFPLEAGVQIVFSRANPEIIGEIIDLRKR